MVATCIVIIVGCKKEKEDTADPSQTTNEAQIALDKIHAFQSLCKTVKCGIRTDGVMSVEEMRQLFDLTANYEYSQHMVYSVSTVLDTIRVPMPALDEQGNVTEHDAAISYETFVTEFHRCMEAVEDGRNIPSYFSILMPDKKGHDGDDIVIVFMRGIEGKYPLEKNSKNVNDNDPFVEYLDDWFWGDSLGLCKYDPYNCSSDAAQQLSEEFVFVIPQEHQGDSYYVSNVIHTRYRPLLKSINGVSSIYYEDPYMDCAETWLFGDISPIDLTPCISWFEMNCFYHSIVRNIVNPTAPLHMAPTGSITTSAYHYCIIEPYAFLFDINYYKMHVAHVIYCDITWLEDPYSPYD